MAKLTLVCSPVYTVKLANTNECIHKGKCIVGNIVISADGVNGDADIYDGENDNGERKFHLEALSTTTFGTGASEEKDFDKGIYIKVNASTTFVSVSFRVREIETEEEKK